MAIKGLKIDRSTLKQAVKQSQKKPEKKKMSGIVEGFEDKYKILKLESGEQKRLYVPNLVEMVEALDEEGNTILDENNEPVMVEAMAIDHFHTHTLNQFGDGKKNPFRGEYRCVRGIKIDGEDPENPVLDGSCPLCDAYYKIETKWIREKAEAEARKKGIDINDEAEMKKIKKELWKFNQVSSPSHKVALPVFELHMEQVMKDGKKKNKPVFAKDENDKPIMITVNGEEHKMVSWTGYWYIMSESRYQKFFEENIAAATEGECTIPAGKKFTLKAGKSDNRMIAAKDTNCVYTGEPEESLKYMYEYFDQIAKESWTDVDAMETIRSAELNSKADIEAKVAKIEAERIKEISILEATKATTATAEAEDDAEINDLLDEVEAE